ncbi:MAG: ParB/RepB/Spo0J family partition protein [Phascolarctobacterium sp.]|nr:ParB/RepB/Spo0J family partition protein [Phascolarctobacterium sp.]
MNNIQHVEITKIQTNPYQPRQHFAEQELQELADSIKRYGILQPLLVSQDDGNYILIAGERRLRAAKLAGLTEVPCVLGEYDDKQKAEIALIENLQRQNLNFFEEAEAMQSLLQEFHLTQEQLAERVSKTQAAIANKIRLLRLDAELRKEILEEKLTERHARALLKVPQEQRQEVLEHVSRYQLNVAQTDDYIERLLAPKEPTHRSIVANDIRIYLNSFKQIVDMMNKGGVKTDYNYKLVGDDVIVTVKFPNKKAR